MHHRLSSSLSRGLSTFGLALAVLAPSVAAETIEVPDDFSDLQAALDAASPGDVIEVSDGPYFGSYSISVPGLTLIGNGTVIDAEFEGPCFVVATSDVTIEDFELINGTSGVASVSFTDGIATPGLTVRGCTISNCGPDAGLLIEGDSCTLVENIITDCSNDGIHYEAINTSSETLIAQNRVSFCTDDGIDARGGGLTISDNTVDHCEDNGIAVDLEGDEDGGGGFSVVVYRNTSNDNGDDGIYVNEVGNAEGVYISDNTCLRNADDGINFLGEECFIVANRCDDNLDDGIDVDDSFAVIIRENTVQRNLENGISADSALTLILENRVKRNHRNGIMASGSALIADNEVLRNVRNGIILDDVSLYEEFDDGGPDGGDSAVVGNRIEKNGFQGISNSATDTAITGNICKKNNGKLGPDIAGLGDGSGSVSEFSGNTGTGGSDVEDRLNTAQD